MTLKLWHTVGDNIHPRTLKNINKWITLNPDIVIERKIFDDNDCSNFLKTFDEKYNTETYKYFNLETDGRFKADIWRLCILYEYGGLYSDIDQEPLIPINQYLNLEDIDFCTIVCPPSNYLMNGLIYCKNPKSKIIKECLDIHLERYEQLVNFGINDGGDMAGIHTMCKAIRGMFENNFVPDGETKIYDEKCLFLSEIPDSTLVKDSLEYMYSFSFYKDNLKVMNTRYFNYYLDKTLKHEFIPFNKNEIFND
jgi:hypothetical protein